MSMANLEYDDFDDVSGSEEGEVFNEDELDDRDYDLLYKRLPQLKTAMSSYNDNIPDIDLKEALYYNYFEIEEGIKELKSRYPKKKAKSNRKYNFFFFFFFLKKFMCSSLDLDYIGLPNLISLIQKILI